MKTRNQAKLTVQLNVDGEEKLQKQKRIQRFTKII